MQHTFTTTTEEGGPTLVLNQTLDTPVSPTLTPPTLAHATLSYPYPNKLLVFDGSLLHGVLQGKKELIRGIRYHFDTG